MLINIRIKDSTIIYIYIDGLRSAFTPRLHSKERGELLYLQYMLLVEFYEDVLVLVLYEYL